MIRSLLHVLPVSLVFWSSVALAVPDVPVELKDPTFHKLSKFDCLNSASTEVGFHYTFAFKANQTVEYYLASDTNCTPPQGWPINTGATTSTNSALIQSLSPRPAADSSGVSFSDTATNLTFAGIWNWYADFKNNASGSTVLHYDSTSHPEKCLDNQNNVTAYLCVLISTPDPTATVGATFHTGAFAIALSSQAPDAPGTPTVNPLDAALEVHWNEVTTPVVATRYDVHVQDPVTNTDVKTEQITNGQLSARIDGLTNGKTYNVFVQSLDDAGSNPPTTSNVSAASPTATGTPVPSISYFEEYHHDGGTELGGCSSAGGLSVVLLLLIPLVLRRRRNAVGLLAGAILLSATARAETPAPENESTTPVARQPSPEWFRVEVYTGPFNPNPDQGVNGTPYAKVFPSKNQLLTRLAFHVNFLGLLGHASLGASIGVWQVNGKSLQEDHSSQANDAEALLLVPITPTLGYRADFIYTRWKVPLVPYAKVGYGFTYFSDTKNGKTVTGVDPATGKTWHSWGWAGGLEWAAGIEVPLDFFDQRRAANLDSEFGINSTGVFGEVGWSYWKGFHGGLNLGGMFWSGGVYLAF